jgi:HEAT repeat protein
LIAAALALNRIGGGPATNHEVPNHNTLGTLIAVLSDFGEDESALAAMEPYLAGGFAARLGAVHRIACLAARHPGALVRLAPVLADADYGVRTVAASAVAAYASPTSETSAVPALVPALVALLGDRMAELRRLAVVALGKMRAGEEEIRRALGDPNESVRLAAREALGLRQ